MAQTCSKCSRANPAYAVYCYFDGFVLAGHANRGGPVAVGAQPFPHPFVFPTGRQSRNFNELAAACDDDWSCARDLLRQGFFATFFGGIGRVDLAQAANEAAKFPDPDRGLDLFINKLPSETRGKAKLAVETQEINLGVVPVGSDRQFTLHLENLGTRLVYGSVTCPDKNPWLTLGDIPGTTTKSIQFGGDMRLTVKVAPDRLRAGNKPLEASLVVETNGGTATVRVRAEVPVKPFPAGLLGGAKSPRQVAEKAKPIAKDAAVLFENGTVAAWYKDNGWTYPVQGPSASGIGAVQQFFEALGLTPPPKVSISERKIVLRGNPGDPLSHTIKVESPEKRPVYAHGTSSQPWLEVSRAKLNGRTATINLSVPAVPNRPGETLTAQLVVQSNGNQRFVVPVTLRIGGDPNGTMIMDFAQLTQPAAPTTLIAQAPLDFSAQPAAVPLVPPRRGQESGTPSWLIHAVPAVLLAVCLFFIFCFDLIGGGKPREKEPVFSSQPSDKDNKDKDKSLVQDNDPLIGVNFNSAHRFGLLMLKEKDPKNTGRNKRLTFKEEGGSNNTCLSINGSEYLFGQLPGTGPKQPRKVYENRQAWETTWNYTTEKIKVRQYVEIVPGEQSQRLDTCLVWYTIENYGTVPVTVGLRVMLDTFIGANDGVPFVIPGQPGLLTDMRYFDEKQIPDYIEALEHPDLSKPGTVAHIGLKGIALPKVDLEPVHGMRICRWPGSEVRWEPEKKDIRSIQGNKEEGEDGDSCVFIYWQQLPMAKGTTRNMAFTYGLGKMAATDTGSGTGKTQLALTSGGSFQPNGEFTVTAYVKGGTGGEKVKLDLPEGLSLLPNEATEKAVDAPGKAGYSQVSWRVKASGGTGDFGVRATSGGVTAKDVVKIRSGGIFGAN
jgi:hypothetical protein